MKLDEIKKAIEELSEDEKRLFFFGDHYGYLR